MNCAKVELLFQYVDQLLSEQEAKQIEEHIAKCELCREVVKLLEEENNFIRETLTSPSLPDDFAFNVLEKLDNYEQKPIVQRKSRWKRLLVSAAGVALAFGVTATFSPSFAELIGGIFGKEVVDEGLKRANEAGLGERVDLAVTDKGLTFKIEDVIADTSRIALSYQVLNEKGISQDTALNEYDNIGNEVSLFDQNGKKLEYVDSSYTQDDGYALLEYSLREYPNVEAVTIKFNLVELDGVEGNWQLELPIDLKEIRKLTKTFALQDNVFTGNGVSLKMNELKLAPSSAEFSYETSFTKEELNKIENQLDTLSVTLGKEFSDRLRGYYQTSLGYRIESTNNDTILQYNTFVEGKGHPIEEGGLQGTGSMEGEMGHVAWNDSFIPPTTEDELTFVLDGVFKTVPSDLTVKVNTDDLKRENLSFEYEGSKMTITEAKIDNMYSLQSSLNPIHKESALKIEMEGSRQAKAPQIIGWALVDDQGKVYDVQGSSEITDDKTKEGLYKTKATLEVYGFTKVPKEFTLYAVTVTKYVELEDKWKVTLN